MSTTSHDLSPEDPTVRISRALEDVRQVFLPLEGILRASEKVFVARARLKAELPAFTALGVPAPDPTRFEKGVPLTSEAVLATFPDEVWHCAADRMLSALEHGFPKIRPEILATRRALLDGRLTPHRCHAAVAGDRREELEQTASELAIRPETLGFVLGQIPNPLSKRRPRPSLGSSRVSVGTEGTARCADPCPNCLS
jgi:hypothetical protein